MCERSISVRCTKGRNLGNVVGSLESMLAASRPQRSTRTFVMSASGFLLPRQIILPAEHAQGLFYEKFGLDHVDIPLHHRGQFSR